MFNLCKSTSHVCFWQEWSQKQYVKQKDWEIKEGCGQYERQSWVGRYDKIFLRAIPKELQHVCLFNVGVGNQ